MPAWIEKANAWDNPENLPHAVGNEKIGMQDEVNLDAPASKLNQRRRDRGEALPPTFAPVTGYEEPWTSAVADNRRRKPQRSFKHGIYAGVSGDMDLAANLFGVEVYGGQFRRSEQEVGVRVDRGSVLLFRPGQRGIMGA